MDSIIPSLVAAFLTLMVVGFDDQKPGTAPADWTVAMTGKGSPRWTVEKDDTAPSAPMVLKQSGTASFPLCVKDDTSLTDGFAEVKFKPLTGEKDQAAGIVWRYTDPDNYYITRANALEDNESLGVGTAVPVPLTLIVTEGVSGSSEGMSKLSLSGPVEVGA